MKQAVLVVMLISAIFFIGCLDGGPRMKGATMRNIHIEGKWGDMIRDAVQGQLLKQGVKIVDDSNAVSLFGEAVWKLESNDTSGGGGDLTLRIHSPSGEVRFSTVVNIHLDYVNSTISDYVILAAQDVAYNFSEQWQNQVPPKP